jgi:hypothetical protein
VTTLIVERGGSRDCPGGTRRQVRGSNGRTSAPALNDQSPQQQRVEPLYGGPGHEVALDTTPLDWQLWRESTQIPEAGGADGQNPGSPVGGSVPRASELKASCPEASRKSSALTAAVAPMRIRGFISKGGSRRAAPGVTIRGTAACTALDAVLVGGLCGSLASSLSVRPVTRGRWGFPGALTGRTGGGSNRTNPSPPESLEASTQARYSRSTGAGTSPQNTRVTLAAHGVPAKAAPELSLSTLLERPMLLQCRTPGLFLNLPASGHSARRVPDYPAACGEERHSKW